MSFGSVLRSEYTKMASLRSTRWTLFAFAVTVVGLGALIAWGEGNAYAQGHVDDAGATDYFFVPLLLGQIAVALLGVLTITGEYSTGAIRGTFTAVPNRTLVVTAKAVLVAGVSLVVGEVVAFATWLVGHTIFSSYGIPDVGLGGHGVLRAVFGAGLYVMAAALFGFALGALLRSSAGSITAAVGGLLVLFVVANLLPGAVGRAIGRYLASNAGLNVVTVTHQDNALTPWVGYGVFTLYWVVILAGAYVLVRRRDT